MMRCSSGNGGATARLLDVSCVILTLLGAGLPSFAESGMAAATAQYCDAAIAGSRCPESSAREFADQIDHA
jgi:hypothetical protein